MKKTIGRIDKADFPELHLEDLDIKMDTGAYTSAIHCHKVKEATRGGESCVKFTLLDPSHAHYNEKEFIAKKYTKKTVKSSFGLSEERFVIKTSIVIFDRTYPIELTLSERSDMKFPVLIGRKFLVRRFVVDPALKNLSYTAKNKQ